MAKLRFSLLCPCSAWLLPLPDVALQIGHNPSNIGNVLPSIVFLAVGPPLNVVLKKGMCHPLISERVTPHLIIDLCAEELSCSGLT